MRFSISFVVIFFVPLYAISQVGIGTTTPSAQLEIKSTNQATPTNTDGILIPKIDEFPVTAPTASQDGMMVYVTGSGTPSKGYYYWDNATTSWQVFSGVNDHDFYKTGTTTQPTDINDDIYTMGNMAIGKNTANFPIDIKSTIATRGMNIFVGGNTEGDIYGQYIENANNSPVIGSSYGSYNLLSGTQPGFKVGSYQVITSTAPGVKYGLYNYLSGDGFGDISGSYQIIDGTGNSRHFGIKNRLTGTGSGNKYGTHTHIIPTAGGTHYGIYSNVTKTGSFAGYFLGNVSVGTTTANNYILPASRGAANQVMQTDGSGSLIWVDGSTLGVEKINDLSDGKSDNDGTDNGSSIFLGINAGLNDDGTDNKNVGIGYEALKTNITGFQNTATGYQSLYFNTPDGAGTGVYNTANGYRSLYTNSTGNGNTAYGNASLYTNSTGNSNAAYGNGSLFYNISGFENTANGYLSLSKNTTGSYNTAYGARSLRNNITGLNNTAIGNQSGYSSKGDRNIFLGYLSGYSEITGSDKLYIENSGADANNALIYGEFDTNILRVNGELQLGNTATTRYAMPTADGNTNQVLQTDGAGSLTWVDPSALDDGDWVSVGGDIERQSGDVYIGNDANTNNNLYISALLIDWDTPSYFINPGYENRVNEIQFDTGSESDPKVRFAETNSGFYSPGADITSYTANGTEAVRFEANGMVKILTAIDAEGTPGTGTLEIGGGLRLDNNEIITNTNNALYIQHNNNGDLWIDNGTFMVDASTNRIGIGTTSPAYQLQVSINSAAKPTSSAWTVTSDERLKKNIKPFTDGLDLIKKIDPIWFTYNGKAGMPNDTGVGTLAQEFQKIAPYMVKPWQYTDEEKGISKTYLGIDYGPLNFVVVNAIKEQQIEIENQRKEIEELKKLVQQLLSEK